ncbi:hypothetical protein DRP98_03570 [candidate division KSB1 bacterium]|nr:MAG: hypothetical protein DRP98_03570 [candidate division KSB1 bacterium]
MKNKKEILSLKGLRINGQSYLLQTFCPYRDRQERVYQKAFLTAKSAKKSQRSQRANYLFVKTLRIYFCGRALQSPIASASGDDSIGVWRRLLQSVFTVKLPFWGQEIEKSLEDFPESGINPIYPVKK